MIQDRIKKMIEWVGPVAIVASLVFVGIEVRQDRNLARAELAAQSFDTLAELRLVFTSDEFSTTYAKMLNQPEELTSAEMLQINGILGAVSLMFVRECYLVERGIFEECDNIVRGNAPLFFGNPYAQSWWRVYRQRPDRVGPGWIDNEIAKVDTNIEKVKLNEVLDGL